MCIIKRFARRREKKKPHMHTHTRHFEKNFLSTYFRKRWILRSIDNILHYRIARGLNNVRIRSALESGEINHLESHLRNYTCKKPLHLFGDLLRRYFYSNFRRFKLPAIKISGQKNLATYDDKNFLGENVCILCRLY